MYHFVNVDPDVINRFIATALFGLLRFVKHFSLARIIHVTVYSSCLSFINCYRCLSSFVCHV